MGSLGRLFAVPMVIVTLMVGGAILVVLLFGNIATEDERPLPELLTKLENPVGGKLAQMAMMPRDKEFWQAARQLALRMQKKDAEALTAEDLDQVVRRLTRLIEEAAPLASRDPDERQNPLHFFMIALGHSGRAEAVGPILKLLDAPNWMTRRVALETLGWLHEQPAARAAVPRVLDRLEDENETVRLMAAYVLTHLAEPGDAAVEEKLGGICGSMTADRELQWNAALTLARLGSGKGLGVLLDLLDRPYWTQKVTVAQDDPGSASAQPISEERVEEGLIAAMDAAAHLDDERIWEAIRLLEKDPSARVKNHAMKLVEERASKAAEGPNR